MPQNVVVSVSEPLCYNLLSEQGRGHSDLPWVSNELG